MDDKNKPDETKPVKKVRNLKGSPLFGGNGLMTEPGDNAKYLDVNLSLLCMTDIDLKKRGGRETATLRLFRAVCRT